MLQQTYSQQELSDQTFRLDGPIMTLTFFQVSKCAAKEQDGSCLDASKNSVPIGVGLTSLSHAYHMHILHIGITVQ